MSLKCFICCAHRWYVTHDICIVRKAQLYQVEITVTSVFYPFYEFRTEVVTFLLSVSDIRELCYGFLGCSRCRAVKKQYWTIATDLYRIQKGRYETLSWDIQITSAPSRPFSLKYEYYPLSDLCFGTLNNLISSGFLINVFHRLVAFLVRGTCHLNLNLEFSLFLGISWRLL